MQISLKQILLLFSGLFLLGCSVHDPTCQLTKTSGTFRIGTYNLQDLFDNIDDPDKFDGEAPSESRLQALSDVILDADCDILAVQEVENIELLNDFNENYLHGNYSYVVLIEGNDPRGIDVGFLSKFPLQNITSYRERRFVNPETGDISRFSRDLLAVSWTDPSGKSWTFLTTHLKAGRTVEDQHARELQVGEIVKICHESGYISAANNGLTVLLGDLNAEPWAYELDPLTDVPFSDPARDLKNRFTHGSGLTLDYILLSPDADSHFDVGSCTINNNSPSDLASDHYLVYVDLYF
ncbi:MAG: endonuclease/exonuclease/phosphatase family protein [bacterium]|nr:endonuclease/exonuclease/phosphatase family protein [bacterium]